MKRDCDSGFHGSLSEDLTNKKCEKCGRNYAQEDFAKACKFFGIDPTSAAQIKDLTDELIEKDESVGMYFKGSRR